MRVSTGKWIWLIIGLSFLLPIILLLLGYQSVRTTEKDAFEEYNRRQLALVKGTAGGLEDHFDSVARRMRGLLSIPGVQRLDEEIFRRELEHSFPELEALGVNDIGLANAEGVLQYGINAPQLEGVDFSSRRYFREAKKTVSSLEYSIEFIVFKGVRIGNKGVALVVPMFTPTEGGGREFAGQAIATLKLDTVAEKFIAPLQETDGGHPFLIDSNYDILWASDQELVGQNLAKESRDFPEFRRLQKNMVGGTFGTGTFSFRAFDDFSARFTEDVEENFLAYAPVNAGKQLWSVGLWASKSEVRRELGAANRIQLTLLAAVILLMFLGSAISIAILQRVSGSLELVVDERSAALNGSKELARLSRSLIDISVADGRLTDLLERSLAVVTGAKSLETPGKALIYLPGKRSGLMVLSAQAGLSADEAQAYGRVNAGRCPCGRALESQEIEYQEVCVGYPLKSDDRDNAHGCYSVPLIFGETVLGLMDVWTPVGYRRDADAEAWLRIAAPLIAGTIKRKQQEDELRRTRVQLID